MKTSLNIFFCILFVTLFSCNNNRKTNEIKSKKLVNNSLETDQKKSEIKTDDSLLVSNDLNIISSLTINQETDFFETGKPLTRYLAIELINKSFFDNKKNTSVNFILADTVPNKKKNGVTEIKCERKIVKFIDKPEDNDGMEIFSYCGQIDFLNKYLIGVSYYEGGEYAFIDRTNGEKTNVFVDYPYISPNKKNIICINLNGYENTADLELYQITNNNVKKIMSASYKNWMPLMENGEMFWSSDGYLYLIVHNTKTFWKENGSLNNQYQYIRIKIL